MLRLLRRATGAATAGALLAGGAVVSASDPHHAPSERASQVRLVAAHGDPPAARDRRIVRYTVRPGDTATGLAVRFHAWTAELVGMNRLGRDAALVVGRRLRIPVVVSAARADRARAGKARAGTARAGTARADGARAGRARADEKRGRNLAGPGRPSRAKVKRAIVRAARARGVDPHLALAVSWQEAGWQMHHVSEARAIGAMQVLPSTGRWMSAYVGRRLHLRRLHDNVAAGVTLLRVLRDQAPLRRAVAGYYQGLAGVREHGMYRDTRRYVANVLALRRALRGGWDPS